MGSPPVRLRSRAVIGVAVAGALLSGAARSTAELSRQVAQRGAAEREAPLIIDPSLGRAAERHLEEVLRNPARASREGLAAALAKEGLADAQVVPFTTLGADKDALFDGLIAFAETTIRPRGMTHLGLAVAGEGRHCGLAAIFSRRLVDLAPLPAAPKAAEVVARGRARRSQSIEALLRVPCRSSEPLPFGGEAPRCLDDVLRLEVQTKSEGVFQVAIPLDRGRGSYTLEILAERDRGPEVAALWTFAAMGARRPIDRGPAAGEQGPNDAGALLRLIDRDRRLGGLAALEPDDRLRSAAEAHAAAVCRTMIAAHTLPGGLDPIARARRAGYAARIAENVAIAPTVAAAHANLLESPSHRRNVLDRAALAIGAGVARREGGGAAVERSASYCVVEIFGTARAQR